jgi:hypothetical protein
MPMATMWEYQEEDESESEDGSDDDGIPRVDFNHGVPPGM